MLSRFSGGGPTVNDVMFAYGTPTTINNNNRLPLHAMNVGGSTFAARHEHFNQPGSCHDLAVVIDINNNTVDGAEMHLETPDTVETISVLIDQATGFIQNITDQVDVSAGQLGAFKYTQGNSTIGGNPQVSMLERI